ncbi:feruloyl-CoA synthase [Magnetospirillum sp. 15-1]|uniref:feruloyl-CoA synthase n=1 Tax=Magnetospirillum sp. 15-1 TaxID=1979370 RepID=UPI000BBC5D5C|nr:feruloyl-CoA synthase [Magnetospirillum sp. 15-1]
MTEIQRIKLGPRGTKIVRLADGRVFLRSPEELGAYPKRYTERLEYWAKEAGDRVFLAERDETGGWKKITFREAFAAVRCIAQSLLDRGLSPDRPVLILSGNHIDHALLGLGAMHVGIPYIPLSPGYSLLSTDYARVRHVVNLTTPGLVYASNGDIYQKAIAATVPDTTEVVVSHSPIPGRATTLFSDLVSMVPTEAVDAAAARVDGATIGKILFTSGSTSMPKGVINSHGMMCSNQQMTVQAWPFLTEKPPVLVDWAPWNHTLGSNKTFGIALYCGGSMYIDHGRPTPEEFHVTAKNLAEIAPTVYFSVPIFYQILVAHLEKDPLLRQNFFSRLDMMFYAGATLPVGVWNDLQRLMREGGGKPVMTISAFGATETGPLTIADTWDAGQPGVLGLPVPGVHLQLVPNGRKLELRIQGAAITPGYWRQPELTEKAFDKDGWYKTGDAVRFVDPDNPDKGLMFDGRLTEDFKLITGTWVSVAPLRTLANSILSPLVRDVVVVGHDREEVGLLIFPELEVCREFASLPVGMTAADIYASMPVRREFQNRLDQIAAAGTSSSNRIVRVYLIPDPAAEGEMTDKRTISLGLVLERRTAEIEELYSPHPSVRVLLTHTHPLHRPPEG